MLQPNAKYDPIFDTATHGTHIIVDWDEGVDMHSADVSAAANQQVGEVPLYLAQVQAEPRRCDVFVRA